METVAICNESFSYSWLMPLKPSFDALDDTLGSPVDTLDDALFFTMDLKSTPSSRKITAPSHDPDFNFPNSQPLTLVPADQLFRNGHLLPLHLMPPRKDCTLLTDDSGYLSDQTPTTESKQPGYLRQQSFLRRCRKSSKQILLLYWTSFLKPIYRKMRKLKTNRANRRCGSSTSSSSSSGPAVGSRGIKCHTPSLLASRESGTRSCSASIHTTPRNSVGYASDDLRYHGISGSDIESSIQAAILHCKKSVGVIDNIELNFMEKEKLGR